MIANFEGKEDQFKYEQIISIPRDFIAKNCGNPIINNLYLTDIGYFPNAKGHYYERENGSAQYLLIYCTAGKGKVTIGNVNHLITAGSFIILPKNISHSYAADKTHPWTIYWAHFLGTGADELAVRFAGTKIPAALNEERIFLFHHICTKLELGLNMDNMIYCCLCFHHFLAALLYADKLVIDDPSEAYSKINDSINFMQLNLTATLSLKALAAAVYLSPSYYSALFRKHTQQSPIDYFNHLKIKKATRYLTFTKLSVKEIAQQLGFKDPYYFSRLFSLIEGVSPRKYREKL